MKLGADVGGTKTLLEARAGAFTLLRKRYENALFASFDDLLGEFLAEVRDHHRAPVTAACLAVAGPVADGTATLTNRPDWRLNAEALGERFGLAQVKLVNDFVGVTAGLADLLPGEMRELQPGKRVPTAPALAVGPGTGCGVGLLIDGLPVASEGGHVALAPFDADSSALWRALGAPDRRVTMEDVLSGRGLLACYQALAGDSASGGGAVQSPADVVTAAEEGTPLAERAVRLFARCFGSFAGDLALVVLAHGGVFLAGGIPPRLPKDLFDGEFLKAFRAKAVYAELAASFPVRLVLADDLGLRGALRLAGEQVPAARSRD